jgi:hypothetical protein
LIFLLVELFSCGQNMVCLDSRWLPFLCFAEPRVVLDRTWQADKTAVKLQAAYDKSQRKGDHTKAAKRLEALETHIKESSRSCELFSVCDVEEEPSRSPFACTCPPLALFSGCIAQERFE